MKLEFNDVKNFSNINTANIYRLCNEDISDRLADKIIEANKILEKLYEIYESDYEKPIRDIEAKKEEERSKKEDIRFNVNDKQAELISSVLIQMSDGYWKGNQLYEKYYKNIHVDGNTVIVNKRIKDVSYSTAWLTEYNKFFTTVEGVKNFFAGKAQFLYYKDKKDLFGKEKFDPNRNARYISGPLNKSFKDIQETIDSLNS